MSESTRERLLSQAMRLFGEQGYAATSVAQIESAAGLKPGSGGLYRHFSSKRDVLAAGIRSQLASQGQLQEFLRDPAALARLPLRDRLTAIAKAALDRLDHERDLNRIILRDLRDFPDLADLVRKDELTGTQVVLASWLRSQAEGGQSAFDWDALAAALMGSVSHYWVLRDSLGGHPSGIDEDRYLGALADLVVARFSAAR